MYLIPDLVLTLFSYLHHPAQPLLTPFRGSHPSPKRYSGVDSGTTLSEAPSLSKISYLPLVPDAYHILLWPLRLQDPFYLKSSTSSMCKTVSLPFLLPSRLHSLPNPLPSSSFVSLCMYSSQYIVHAIFLFVCLSLSPNILSFLNGGGGGGRVGAGRKNVFASFSTQSFHCIFIMIIMKKYGENTKNIFFHGNGGHIRF